MADTISVTPIYAGAVTSGRNEDVWGARRVGLYRIVLSNSAPAGGYTFDPRTYGFDKPVAFIEIHKRLLVANVAKQRYGFIYDYVNKKIVPTDATDSYDDASGDDLSTITLDVIVYSE